MHLSQKACEQPLSVVRSPFVPTGSWQIAHSDGADRCSVGGCGGRALNMAFIASRAAPASWAFPASRAFAASASRAFAASRAARHAAPCSSSQRWSASACSCSRSSSIFLAFSYSWSCEIGRAVRKSEREAREQAPRDGDKRERESTHRDSQIVLGLAAGDVSFVIKVHEKGTIQRQQALVLFAALCRALQLQREQICLRRDVPGGGTHHVANLALVQIASPRVVICQLPHCVCGPLQQGNVCVIAAGAIHRARQRCSGSKESVRPSGSETRKPWLVSFCVTDCRPPRGTRAARPPAHYTKIACVTTSSPRSSERRRKPEPRVADAPAAFGWNCRERPPPLSQVTDQGSPS